MCLPGRGQKSPSPESSTTILSDRIGRLSDRMDGQSEGQHPQGQTGAGTPQHGQKCLCWKADGRRNRGLAGAGGAMGNCFAARTVPGGAPFYFENTYFLPRKMPGQGAKKFRERAGGGLLKPMQNLGSGSRAGAGSRAGDREQDEAHAKIKRGFKRDQTSSKMASKCTMPPK